MKTRAHPFQEPNQAGLDERRLQALALAIDPDTVEQDLARIVFALMEFLRELMELQAIRRMEAGALTPEEEERLGLTLMRAEAAIREQAAHFGLRPEDLSLDLGPLGRTI
ncbi:MAG: gas vesicle protein K [Pseudomonadota bacterium]